MQCDTSLLWTLVEQSTEPGDESESIVRHVESCARCRETLVEIGGDPTLWDEARRWLSQEVADMPEQAELQPLPPIDLSFLETATHPEMLGRIGRYDVESVLGRGGMGVVLRAYDSELHRSVAVKVMAPEWAASMPARKRFAREAQAAASVAHENVIPIYNVEADALLPFLVMRYIPGMTLERWVKSNGPLDVATILRVAGQLAEGLAAAHRRGLVHRDIKPGNVLVGENIDRVWITDFGLARAADSITLTQTGVIAGTPHYMSPEQARGEVVDHRSDLFSLGCVLYFLSTGRPPFDADNTLAVLHKIVSEEPMPLASMREGLPPSFVLLVHQLLRREPEKRPHDCDDVTEKLSVAQTELGSGLRAKPPLSPAFRLAMAYAGIAASVAMLIGGFLWMKPAARTPDAIASNPWRVIREAQTREPVSPYVAQASEQIADVVIIDADQYRQQVVSLAREIQRLDQPRETLAIPSLLLDDEAWRRDVQSMAEVIERLNQ